jgi:hypothetical protein
MLMRPTTAEIDGEYATMMLMDRPANVSDAHLMVILNSICYGLAQTFLDGGANLTASTVEDYLPGETLNVAIYGGLIPEPPEADYGVAFGDFIVPTGYREWFLGRLQSSLSTLRDLIDQPIPQKASEIAAENLPLRTTTSAIRWKHPTPPERIQRFLGRVHWFQADLIRKVSGIDDYVDETTKQMFKRLYKPPKSIPRTRIHVRTLPKLQRCRDIMAEADPEECGTLTVYGLCWTPE